MKVVVKTAEIPAPKPHPEDAVLKDGKVHDGVNDESWIPDAPDTDTSSSRRLSIERISQTLLIRLPDFRLQQVNFALKSFW